MNPPASGRNCGQVDMGGAFEIGKEILCYRNREEAIEMAEHYIARPDQCRQIAVRARERCLREHQWIHRFARLGKILGFCPAEPTGGA